MSSKVKQLTVESFYRKRLCAVDPIWEEYYLKIAEKLVEKGYESPRLLDNIIESLPREFNPEFYSVMIKVNPKMHDNSHLAEKKMGRAIVAQLIETSFLNEITSDDDPQIAQKQKQQTAVKKQILQKKLIAVRQGSQDVTASHEPEGEMVEAKVDTGTPEEKEKVRNVRKFGVSHNVAGHGKLRRSLHKMNRGDKKIKGDKSQYVETESVQIEGVGEVIKKGVKRHKDAVDKKKVADRKAVPYTALAAETEHEGSVVVEKIKNMVREKVITELSKRTLGNYVKDASSDAAMKSMDHGNKPLAKDAPKREKKILNRLSGIRKATDKLSKEEVEHVDEKISASGYARAKKWREDQAREKDRKNNPAYYAEVDKIRAAKAKRKDKAAKNLASNMKKEEIILDYLKERDLPESIVEKLSEDQKAYIMDLYIEQSENINGSVGEVQGESV